MPKRLIKRLIPDANKLRDHKQLRWLGKLLHDPNIMHLNRSSVSGAVSVGLFVALIPTPFQMPIAALSALLFRVNLPISVILVWVSNPITMPAIFYFCYLLGAWILQVPISNIEFEMTTQWLIDEFSLLWKPILLGSLIVGVLSAVLGNIAVRLLWRLQVIKKWKERKARKLRKKQQSSL